MPPRYHEDEGLYVGRRPRVKWTNHVTVQNRLLNRHDNVKNYCFCPHYFAPCLPQFPPFHPLFFVPLLSLTPPPHSLTPCLLPSLLPSLPHSFPPSLTPSLPPSLPLSLTHPLPPSLTPSLPPSSRAGVGLVKMVFSWLSQIPSHRAPLSDLTSSPTTQTNTSHCPLIT